jgi:hypothetical protein
MLQRNFFFYYKMLFNAHNNRRNFGGIVFYTVHAEVVYWEAAAMT